MSSASTTEKQKTAGEEKPRHAGVFQMETRKLRPCPENLGLYGPVNESDPEFKDFAKNVRTRGILVPLVITADRYIISGHRRLAAARMAGLERVPCFVEPIHREDNPGEFVRLLAAHNGQRQKTRDQRLREVVVLNADDGDDAYDELITYREQQERVDQEKAGFAPMAIRAAARRHRISANKMPFLDSVKAIVQQRKSAWPISIRSIHYALLNNPPLRMKNKPTSRYRNDDACYEDLDDLLARARIDGLVPWESIGDETRPVDLWPTHRDTGSFVRKEFGSFMRGYYRDLMQSQPNHIEVVCEKNTVAPTCRSVCKSYCIPMTTSRGYCSLPPRKEIVKRFKASGKSKLILLIVSDFDPDGEGIAESFASSVQDEFGLEPDSILAAKVALTHEQTKRFKMKRPMKAKRNGKSREKIVNRFIQKYGSDNTWELEALNPDQVRSLLDEAIKSTIDLDAFNHEREEERRDAVHLKGIRQRVMAAIRPLDGLGLGPMIGL